MPEKSNGFYIALLSVHGLIRAKNLELGKDADTGGQILYALELAQALSRLPEVAHVDLFTRLIIDESVAADYANPVEHVSKKLQIVRIPAGPNAYLQKEQLWDHLDGFADNIHQYFKDSNRYPDLIHSHYADAGFVGAHLANQLAVPVIHTGHSLGRVKRLRLLASGLSNADIENRYHMIRRIEAEELILATAERVIASTHQEIEEQYGLYDFYQPKQMRVVPPGTDLTQFFPPTGKENKSALFFEITKHLFEPEKPIILALSRPDKRKNIAMLIAAYGQNKRLQDQANLLIIAGNRDDIDDLEDGAQEVFHEIFTAIDRYDLYGKVALPKHHRRDQVAEIYRIAAASGGVFVNPALTEPFGLTLIEAAASGLPIVATEDGGPKDIISNCRNGFLIDPLEAQSISHALNELFDNKDLWHDFVNAGLSGVKAHYSWDAHAKQYLKIITPIIQRSEQLIREPIKRRNILYFDRAIVSDLDQNLIGNDESLQRLISILRDHRKNAKFVIATGRRLDSALKLMKKHHIPEPDILITSSGTDIYYAPKLTKDIAWPKHINYQWNPPRIKQLLADYPGLEKQPKLEQSQFKISYFFDPAIAEIEAIKTLLHKEEQSVHIQVAFGQYLDILAQRASKGQALRYVADHWQIPLERVFVAGGSGADEDMMRGNTLAAVVANRHHEELSQLIDVDRIYFAEKPLAEGIIEALQFYDFFNTCKDPRENKNRESNV